MVTQMQLAWIGYLCIVTGICAYALVVHDAPIMSAVVGASALAKLAVYRYVTTCCARPIEGSEPLEPLRPSTPTSV